MTTPYTPSPLEPDPELTALARRGDARRRALTGPSTDTSLAARQALGGHSSRPIRIGAAVVMGAGLIASLVGFIVIGTNPTGVGVGLGALGLVMIAMLVSLLYWPTASAATLAAEEAWVAARPFPLAGYLEVLGQAAQPTRQLVLELRWGSGQPPEPTLVERAIAAVDPRAALVEGQSGTVTIRLGPRSGHTGRRLNGRYLFRNHHLVGQVHALAEHVLPVLHRACPIARASLREWRDR